jgi:hypothetical protein
MKMKFSSIASIRNLFFASVVFCALGAPSARAVCSGAYDAFGHINVGPTGQKFTVFGVAGFNMAPDPVYTNNTFTGPSMIVGNVGVGPNGTFSASDGMIDGSIYMYDGPGSFHKSGPTIVTGSVNYNATAITSAAFTDYQNLSNNAADCASTSNYTINGSSNGVPLNNVNITSNSNTIVRDSNPFGGSKIVLNLTNFKMSSGTFTLEGTATTTYIINVQNQFSLNNAKILLADMNGNVYNGANPDPMYAGITPSNVLFNIRSKGIQISLNQGTEMSGILLALKDQISQSGGKVYGKTIGGQVNITSGGKAISRF